MSSIMKGLNTENVDPAFKGTIDNITAQNPKGSAAEKMILDRFLSEPKFKPNWQQNFVAIAHEWLQNNMSWLRKKYPEVDLSDPKDYAEQMYVDYLYRIGKLEEDDMKEDTAYAGGMGQGHTAQSYHYYKAQPAGLKENLLNTYADQFNLPKESAISKGLKETDKLDMNQDELINKIWGPKSQDLRNKRYIIYAPEMKVQMSVDKPDEAIKIAKMIARRNLNSPVTVTDRQTNFPIAQYRGSEDVDLQKKSSVHETYTAADVKKDLEEAERAVFDSIKSIWTQANREPKNDEDFLGMAERYAKLLLFADLEESKKQRAAESLATALLPLWHEYHWNKTGFKEGYSAGAVGGAGLGEIASRNNPTGTGWRHTNIEPAGLDEGMGPDVIRLGRPQKHPVQLGNGKFDEVTEYPIFKNKSHVGMLTFSKFFGELYGDMGGKAIPTMSIKFDASDPLTANTFFQKWLKSPEGVRRVTGMSNTKMRTKVLPDEPYESAVMKGLRKEDIKRVEPAVPVLPIQQTQTNPKQEPYVAPDKKTPAAIIDIKKSLLSDLEETWSKKYKKSINCNNPKGFSQKAHCAGRKARQAGKKTKSKAINEYNTKPETFKDEYGKQRGIADLYQRMLEILKDPENTRKVQQIIDDFNVYYSKINKKPIKYTLKQFREYARNNPAMEGYWNQIVLPKI